MKKVYWEILLSIVLVFGGTAFMYNLLVQNTSFWESQWVWSVGLIIGWTVVAFEYYREGWMIHNARSTANISPVLPMAVFVMQCILFAKGIFFNDWSLIVGTLIVNSGIVFTLYQIFKKKKKH